MCYVLSKANPSGRVIGFHSTIAKTPLIPGHLIAKCPGSRYHCSHILRFMGMTKLLSVSEVKGLINKAEESFRHEECRTCECYLGYVTQMEIDSDHEAQDYLREYQPPKGEIHACLGCDPCPPGILYSQYLRTKQK